MDSSLKLRGAYTALITPMRNGEPDWVTLEKCVERQIEAGMNGLVPVGTTGESPTLNTKEHLRVIEEVVRISAGRIPVIAGTGANATSEALELTKAADRLGADGFLQVAPYYNKPSQAGVYAHFAAIAECTEKPIMLYSIPGRCGIDIAVDTVARLAEKFAHVRTIKEAGGDVQRVVDLKKRCGPELTIFSGDDGLTLEFIRQGAHGIVSVASNLFPDAVVSLTKACLEGDFEKAEAIQKEFHSLFHDLVFLEGNPVTIKEAVFQAGLIPSSEVRLPLVEMSDENKNIIRQHLANLNFLPSA